LVVAKVKERLAMSKRPVKKMDMGRFSPKKLLREKLKNSIRLQSKTSLQLWRIMGTSWDTVRDGIIILAKESISHCESKHHKPWFDDECSDG
jgi:hypothetical protein